MRVVTLGEVMLRLCPEEFLRISQVIPGKLEATFGGGEVNVAMSVAQQGGQSAFATALPDNAITDAFTQQIRGLGIDTSLVKRTKTGRFGVYFVENGANQRASTVTYDRDGSSMALAAPGDFDWDAIFKGATWFHITGITPALSASAAEVALHAVKTAAEKGLTVSCDLNFRKKLWRWRPGTGPSALAQDVMRRLLGSVHVVIANEEDADLSLGIKAAHTNVEAGHIDTAGFAAVAKTITEQFPTVRQVAITLRESLSATHNNWGALLYTAEGSRVDLAPSDSAGNYQPYEIHSIVDRVGAGDSFAGGLIYALNTPELKEPQTALRYAVAASCLKHSIKGDFNFATRGEIEALMGGAASGRVQR